MGLFLFCFPFFLFSGDSLANGIQCKYESTTDVCNIPYRFTSFEGQSHQQIMDVNTIDRIRHVVVHAGALIDRLQFNDVNNNCIAAVGGFGGNRKQVRRLCCLIFQILRF